MIDGANAYTPKPAISHAIRLHNLGRSRAFVAVKGREP